MSQGDQFHQYGYDHYLKAPRRTGNCGRNSARYGKGGLLSSLLYSLGTSSILRKVQSPVVAGSVLFGAVVLFSGVIMMTYSSNNDANEPVPLIKADVSDIKQAPGDPGGMEIPYSQSTIMARGDQPSAEAQTKTVENLLAAQGSEDLISKEEAFDRATQSPIMGENYAGDDFAGSVDAQDDLAALHAQAGGAIDVVSEQNAEALQMDSEAEVKPAFELEKPGAEDILQKIGSSKEDGEDSHFSKAFVDKAASAAARAKPDAPLSVAASLLSAPMTSSAGTLADIATTDKPDHSNLHSAGQSPETLKYVRSVLSHDSGGVEVHNIEPAIGTSPDVTTTISPSNIEVNAGSYFVQLASITEARRAQEEWEKMQNKYSVLDSSRFRVQEATLPGGTFYRIQAGPMSKESADQICDALKQANKPGGCLVVK